MTKILVIRFSSIGDIVLTTPVIRCLKKQLPGAEVHFLTKQAFRSVIENNPYVDKVITIEKDVREVIPLLKAENYTYIADLHKNLRSFEVLLNLKKRFHSFTKLNVKKYLICNFKIDILPRIHIVDRYFEAVWPLGVHDDRKGLDYFIPGKDEVDIETLPEVFRAGYLALVIGGKHATKQMPVSKLIETVNLISRPVVILGGKEDKETGEAIMAGARGNIYNACGLFNLNQSASLIRQADKVITHDTGLMHIAAGFKKDILSIWGNTIPEFGMSPLFPINYQGQSKIVEVKGLSCRPCSKLGYPKCPKGHFRCMMDIPVRDIALWANKM